VLYKGLDEKYPATLSKKIIHDLLRKEMGFKGLVITDDLEMKAISDNYAIGEAAIGALSAGADIILVCKELRKQKDAFEAILKAVKDNIISEKRIDESIERITVVKKRYLKDAITDEKKIKDIVGIKGYRNIAKEIIS
ncbi:MAG: beta-N-acetylhexosaminidase, partial [Nitrospirae bacterium]|nr:beta-N-acetylhexosaminidase [Nitrospirota bacterium]